LLIFNRKRSSPRLSRLAETPLRATGPAFTPRLLRDRMSQPFSPTSVPPQPDPLPPLVVMPVLPPVVKLPRKPRRKRSPRRTSTWATFSVAVMTTTEQSI